MICPCGGHASSYTYTARSRKVLLRWFPDAGDTPLPVLISVMRCKVCGRQDKSLSGNLGQLGLEL